MARGGRCVDYLHDRQPAALRAQHLGDDFDRVLQAACQEALRALVRQDLAELRGTLSACGKRYSISVMTITYAQPPAAYPPLANAGA